MGCLTPSTMGSPNAPSKSKTDVLAEGNNHVHVFAEPLDYGFATELNQKIHKKFPTSGIYFGDWQKEKGIEEGLSTSTIALFIPIGTSEEVVEGVFKILSQQQVDAKVLAQLTKTRATLIKNLAAAE